MGWQGCEKCLFCHAKESVNHLFLECALARYIWYVVKCAFDIDVNVNSVRELVTWLNQIKVGCRKVVVVVVGLAAVLRSL